MSIIMQINPFDFFTDTNGDALDAGYIWIGQPNLDPRQYPVTAFYDEALTIPAAMPLRTSNGYIVRNGAPTFLFINGNYSVMVLDKKGRQVYYVPDFLMISSGSAVSSGDLISTAAGKGAWLVGWSRSALNASIKTVHQMLDAQAVSVWEAPFADLVTTKPDQNDPSTWDWTAALQAFLDTAGDLILPHGFTYNTTKTLQMRSNTRLTINGTLRFADQLVTLSSEHLLQAGGQADPRTNIAISGFGTIDGNYQNRQSFAPTSGAYLFLGREIDGLIISGDRLKWVNAPSSAIAGVQCSNAVVMNNDGRNIREHGIYFSTDSTGLLITNNSLNDLGVGNAYSADALKLRNNCSFFIISDNKVNDTATVTTTVVRGVVLDESDNVSPLVDAVCHDGLVCDNLMFHLSTGIWCKGSLIDSAEVDSFFQMNVEFAGNTFAAKSSGSLFAGILEKVRRVDVSGNKFLNFTAGVYGGGIGDIKLINNIVRNRIGSTSDGIRMLDTVYNNTTLPSRLRGDVTIIDNKVSGYNGAGLLITVANATDDISGNDIVSDGRAINYADFNLSTAPASGIQVSNVANNARLETTGVGETAVFFNARAAITVQHSCKGNTINSVATGVAYSIAQQSTLVNNKINSVTPFVFGSGAAVFRDGNYNGFGPLGNTLAVGINYTLSVNESGVSIYNQGAGVTRTYTLPPSAPGLTYTILRTASFPLRVDPDGAEIIRGGGAGKYLQINADGDFVTLRCIVDTVWEVVESRGAFTFEP